MYARISVVLALVAIIPRLGPAQARAVAPVVSVGVARMNIGEQLGPASYVGVGVEGAANAVTLGARIGWSHSFLASPKCIEAIHQACGPGGFPQLFEVGGMIGVRPNAFLHAYAGPVFVGGNGNSAAAKTSALRFSAGVGIALSRRVSLGLEVIDGPHLNDRPFHVARAVAHWRP